MIISTRFLLKIDPSVMKDITVCLLMKALEIHVCFAFIENMKTYIIINNKRKRTKSGSLMQRDLLTPLLNYIISHYLLTGIFLSSDKYSRAFVINEKDETLSLNDCITFLGINFVSVSKKTSKFIPFFTLIVPNLKASLF